MQIRMRWRMAIYALLLTAPAWSQVRKLHTRDLTRLSQVQVADYLKRSDIIFIPVGAVETNGIMPSDRDYVSPLAYAMAMADELDALYMPGLIWSYPGTTMIARRPSTSHPPRASTSSAASRNRSCARASAARSISRRAKDPRR